MQIIKQYIYDNTWLEYWDMIIIDEWDWCYKLWMVKSTYHDWKTDCSWHFVLTNNWKEAIDISWWDIAAKLEWEWVDILKTLILTGKVEEPKDKVKMDVIENINYLENHIKNLDYTLKKDKATLEKYKEQYEQITWEKYNDI